MGTLRFAQPPLASGQLIMRQFLSGLNYRPAATDTALTAAEKQLAAKFPPEYVEFLKITNGGEGFVGKSAYVILWGVEELASMNQSYTVQKYAPGLLAFGSNDGGEAFGFDTREQQYPIVQVPFIGMAWEFAEPMGRSFTAFLKILSELT